MLIDVNKLQWCYYSPSIFLASSQTAPAPYVVLTLMQDGSPSRKALDLDVLTEKWRTVNSLGNGQLNNIIETFSIR